MIFTVLSHYFFILFFAIKAQGFCGDSIRWAHRFNIEDVYGVWYGVGYAQHTPDMTNKPNEVGCVTLHIKDVTTESPNERHDWSVPRHNNSDILNWRMDINSSWSKDSLSRSETDVRVKRDIYNERRLLVIWDEDGDTVEQTYVYTPDEPGLWVAEQLEPSEREIIARGISIWTPDDPPRHPQVIRMLKVTPQVMILNHCSEVGGGVFSLILRSSPSRVESEDWYDYKKQFFDYDLPNMYRYTTICSGCVENSSLLIIILCLLSIFMIL